MTQAEYLEFDHHGRMVTSVEIDLEQVEEAYDSTEMYGVISALQIAIRLRDAGDELSDQSATLILDEMALIANDMRRSGKELTPATVARLERLKADCPGRLFGDDAD